MEDLDTSDFLRILFFSTWYIKHNHEIRYSFTTFLHITAEFQRLLPYFEIFSFMYFYVDISRSFYLYDVVIKRVRFIEYAVDDFTMLYNYHINPYNACKSVCESLNEVNGKTNELMLLNRSM